MAAAGARSVSLDLPIATVLMNPRQEWSRLACGCGRMRIARNLEVDWNQFNQDRYLFSHCTIVASVAAEDNGYLIKPACNDLVNNNGNAWTNEVLLSTFRTFVGGENYLEHVQVPELSKGKLLDAVLRPLTYKDKEGRTADIYYCDILVATDRKHDRLVKKIAAGELTTMSMGCAISGTPMTMLDGATKPVEMVRVGDKVRTHTGGVAEVESIRTRQTVSGELRRLSLTGIPNTYVTGEHPYWALIGYDVCIGCGKEMGRSISKPWKLDQILHHWCSESCKQKHSNSNPKCGSVFEPVVQKVKFGWVPVEELRKGDYVAVPMGRKEANRAGLDKFKCVLLGYYAAEGNLQKSDKGEPMSVEFSLHADEPAGDEIMAAAREWGISESSIYSQERNRKSGRSRRIVIHDREMAEWMQKTCGEYCDEKRFAGWVMNLDDESLLSILGAYISGDGHCRKDSARFTTASCSRALSEQVLSMLMFLSVPSNISESKVNGKKPAWYVNTRKGHAGILAGRTFKFRNQQANHSGVSNVGGYMLRRVTRNDPIDLICDVHNVHVKNEDGDHSYILNGVAVHNCLADWVTCSRCGKVLGDNMPNCRHLDHELMARFRDKQGVERVVAELCGRTIMVGGKRVGDPKSVKFIEASWVEHPAFYGAVLNHYVSELPKGAANILNFPTDKLQLAMEDIFKLRVADRMGMMTLRVAQAEIARRMREDRYVRIASRIVSGVA